uniref:transcription factor SPT20 homolog n=1 Tax=Jaculus jaculus TaxID=51337 RepID=UPI001E1B5A45|nr:transcription factor SPT20 homolog [Jaculus jaculus]
MKRALQATLDHVDDTVESVRRQPPRSRPSLRREKSLHEKLYDIYLEECEKEPVVPGLKSNVSLLEKLVRRESLPCLVVNLYPEEEGYSLMLKDKTGSLSEAFHVTCVKERLLEFLDAKELPPVLIDVLEKSPVNVFQQGCVIAEVRDYRLSSSTEPAGYQSQYTLLRPTMQTLAYDVATMTSGNSECTQEEKLELESQLILATAEPLCLDPSASVTLMSNGLLCNEQKMKTDSMRQSSKRHAWSSLDVEKPSTGTPPPDTTAVIVCKRETESEIDHRHDLSIPEAGMCVDKWKQQSCAFAVPSEVDLQKYAEGQPSMSCDDSKPAAGQLWPAPEEKHGCIIKCEDGSHLWVPMPGSDGSMAVIKTEVEEAVDMFQEPVQSKAVYPCPMPQESSSLSSLGLPTSAMMAKSSVGPPSVSEEKEKIHAPQVTLLSRIRQGSSGIKHRTLQVSRPRKLPRLAPAPPKSASQIRNAFGMVGTLLLAAQPSISSDPSSTTGMNVLNLLGLPPGVPVLQATLQSTVAQSSV